MSFDEDNASLSNAKELVIQDITLRTIQNYEDMFFRYQKYSSTFKNKKLTNIAMNRSNNKNM